MAPPTTGPTFKGSRLVRGPMAGDHYTRIHNIAVRGAIPTRYVGVFGYISSHEEGWMLTTAGVASTLNVGPDFVTSALRAIEEAGCLIRGRERDAAGKLHGSVWFVTDLPFQLQQLGIDDPAVIEAQVRAAYDKWLAGQPTGDDEDQGDDGQQADEPDRENPILAVTRENAADGEGFPRSEPDPGFPGQAQPDQAQPAHKKNKGLEDQGLEEPPPPPADAAATPAGGQAATGGSDSLDEQTRAMLNTAADTAAAVRAGADGWQPAQIRAAVRAALDAGHAPALVAERLAVIAADPVGTAFPTRLRKMLDAEAAAAATAAARKANQAGAGTPSWAEGPVRYVDPGRPRCPNHRDYPADNCAQHRIDARIAAAEAADQVDAPAATPAPPGNAREAARTRAAAARETSRTRKDRRPIMPPRVPRQAAPAEPALEPAAPAPEPVGAAA